MDGWIESEEMDEWTEGWMHGRTNGLINIQMD